MMYRLAGVFVFPSLYEGFGLPPLEAMASGTPVVTSNVSSLPEVAGDAAVLVDPYDPEAIADGIYRVLTDEDLRDGPAAERARAGAASSRGNSRCAASARSTREVRLRQRGPAHRQQASAAAREARARPRLADRHARRREGARGPLRALSRRRAVHAGPRPRVGLARHRARRDRTPRSSSTCRASAGYYRQLPAALPHRDRAVRLRPLRPGRQHQPLRAPSRSCARPGAAPLLLPHADAVRLGPVRRVFRAGADWAGRPAG